MGCRPFITGDMMLTDPKLQKNVKPTGKDYQLADGGGLSLIVRAKGKMTWRYEYRVNGKKEKLTLGNYPAMSLAEARRLHQEKKLMVDRGESPIATDQAEQRAVEVEQSRVTFGKAAERYKAEWIDRNWKNPEKAWQPIALHLLPTLGDKPLEEITIGDIRALLYEKRERNGEQAALYAHSAAKRIFAYAVEHEWCTSNPALMIASQRIGSRRKRSRYLSTAEMKRYLNLVYQSSAYRGYKLGLHLLLMLGLRLHEVVQANWSEIDLDKAEWRIPAERMKGGLEHIVLLPPQAVEILHELQHLGSGSEWLFPMKSDLGRPMHGNNVGSVHRAVCITGGIDDYHVHDHRHTLSTHLHEMGYPPDVIEATLAHALGGMRGVYNNAEYREQRKAMLQAWADHLDSLVNGASIIRANFRKSA